MSNMAATENFVPVARVGDLENGKMKVFTARDREILLAMVANKYYAADNICPHMGANLSFGKLGGTILTCPRHASKFDLIDGRVIRWTDWTGIKARASKLFRPVRPLGVYPVKVEGDNILVGI